MNQTGLKFAPYIGRILCQFSLSSFLAVFLSVFGAAHVSGKEPLSAISELIYPIATYADLEGGVSRTRVFNGTRFFGVEFERGDDPVVFIGVEEAFTQDSDVPLELVFNVSGSPSFNDGLVTIDLEGRHANQIFEGRILLRLPSGKEADSYALEFYRKHLYGIYLFCTSSPVVVRCNQVK